MLLFIYFFKREHSAIVVLPLIPVLSELHSSVSFSPLSPGLGPCFIHVAMVNCSVRFWGTTNSGTLAARRPSKWKTRSLSRPLSVSSEAVQFVEALGAGRRSTLPEAAPAETTTVRTVYKVTAILPRTRRSNLSVKLINMMTSLVTKILTLVTLKVPSKLSIWAQPHTHYPYSSCNERSLFSVQ